MIDDLDDDDFARFEFARVDALYSTYAEMAYSFLQKVKEDYNS